MKRIVAAIVLSLASCKADLTTLGSVGTWSVVESPENFRHFRALWVDGQNRPYTIGIPNLIAPPPDAGPDDAAGEAEPDAFVFEEAAVEAAMPDAPMSDAAMPDALTFDSAVPDAPVFDSAMPDLEFPIKSALLRRDETGWTDVCDLPMVANAGWAAAPGAACAAGTDAFACGPGFPLEQPKEWADFTAVWAAGLDHVWFAGTSILEKNGDTRIETPLTPADRILAIWGTSASDVWAVSEASAIRHWDGVHWSSQPSGVEYSLRALWGTGARDVWTVGDGGTVLHFDGTRWSPLASGIDTDLAGVWGSSTDDVWIVGSNGTILHWNGAELSPFLSPTKENLTAVVASSAEAAWAVGPHVVLRFAR